MNHHSAKIYTAILAIQQELSTPIQPLGFDTKNNRDPERFYWTTVNFMATLFAAHIANQGTLTHSGYLLLVNKGEVAYANYLEICTGLKESCGPLQIDDIKLIISKIIKRSEEMKAEVSSGKREPSVYLEPLDTSNQWGKAVLALAEAFDVAFEKQTKKIVQMPVSRMEHPFKDFTLVLNRRYSFPGGESEAFFMAPSEEEALRIVGKALGLSVAKPPPTKN